MIRAATIQLSGVRCAIVIPSTGVGGRASPRTLGRRKTTQTGSTSSLSTVDSVARPAGRSVFSSWSPWPPRPLSHPALAGASGDVPPVAGVGIAKDYRERRKEVGHRNSSFPGRVPKLLAERLMRGAIVRQVRRCLRMDFPETSRNCGFFVCSAIGSPVWRRCCGNYAGVLPKHYAEGRGRVL